MSTLGAMLAAQREGGASVAGLLEAAATFFGDSAALSAELADAVALERETRERYVLLEREVRAAYQRYPVVRRGSFHGGTPELRPPALYATLSTLQKGGLYLPAELDALRAAGEANDAFVTAAWLRLAVAIEAVFVLIAAVDDERIEPKGYREGVEELARTAGGLPMAARVAP